METAITYDFHSFYNLVSRQGQLDLWAQAGSLPYYRRYQSLVSGSVDDLMDRLGSLVGWSVFRFDEDEAVLRSDKAVARVRASVRAPLAACTIDLWATGRDRGEHELERLKTAVGVRPAERRTLSIDWCHPSRHGLQTTSMSELVDETVHAGAYPWLPGGLTEFTAQFLAARASVLILYGPPGVGKTRLVRHLLAALSFSHSKAASILYTADPQAVESDDFFVRLMTGGYDALVIEDADHLLEPRSDGNRHLHRLLGASDGLIQPRGKRLIFTTNLPSRLDVDEALTRPGRCLGCIGGRHLTTAEALALIADIDTDESRRALVRRALSTGKQDKFPLASIYAAIETLTAAIHGQELPETAGHVAAHSA